MFQRRTAQIDLDSELTPPTFLEPLAEEGFAGNAALQEVLPTFAPTDPLADGWLGAAAQQQAGAGEDPGAAPRPPGFKESADRAFSAVDTDGDGFLSKKELEAAMVRKGDGALTGADAAAIMVLRQHRDDLEEQSNDEWFDENDGVTRADLARYADRLREAQESGKPLPDDIKDIEGIFGDANARVAGTSRELFPNGGPSQDAVRQGQVGSCAFVAAVDSLVAQGRGDEIVRMIQTNSDGSYTVTFPGRPPVRVEAPTDVEIARGSTAGANGLWLTVLEKAYGHGRDGGAAVDADGADSGSTLRAAMGTLTGHDTNVDDLALTRKGTTHDRLTAAMRDGAVVTAGISIRLNEDEGLPSRHAYTVLNYDPATRMVTLRNPWGFKEPTRNGQPVNPPNDGVFTMPLAEFDKKFSDVAYEERPR